MGKLRDLTGQKFGHLLVLERAEDKIYKSKKAVCWKCKCNCRNIVIVQSSNLVTGNSTNCGCIRKKHCVEGIKKKNTKHNQSHNRIYSIWQLMKDRCYNINNKNYKNYGRRGIKVCEEWKNDFMSFYNWAMKNGYRDDLTIDRIDVNGNYESSNCRWVTIKQQQNNKRNNHILYYKNEKHNITEWASILRINRATIYSRLKYGWSIEEALSKK